MAKAMPEIAKRSKQMKDDKECHQGPARGGHANPTDLVRPGVFEPHRKNGELVLVAKRRQKSQLAFPDRVVLRHDVVEQSDSHRALSELGLRSAHRRSRL